MPPIPAVADGSCQTFKDARWLRGEEIEAIARWTAAGAPEGDPEKDKISTPPQAHLGSDALERTMPAPYTPQFTAEKQDEYRCFMIDPSFPTTSFLTATEFFPGAAELVHHIVVFSVDPARDLGPFTNAEGIALMDGDDPEPGWSCFGGLGAGAQPRSQLSTWFSGNPVSEMPKGSGMTVLAGDILVLQLHYRLHDHPPGPDQTSIRLRLASHVDQPVTTVFSDPVTFGEIEGARLEPGRADAQFHWELPVSVLQEQLTPQPLTTTPGFKLFGAAPHMHNLGEASTFPSGGPALTTRAVSRFETGILRGSAPTSTSIRSRSPTPTRP